MIPRLLKQRTGHAEAPTKLRFYSDDPVAHGAKNLISCSADGALRDTCLHNEFQSLDFSIKNLNTGKLRSHNGLTELTPVIDFGFSENR